ncbi:hypothetical protein IEI94_07475 [Halomonas sp. ML-15]|uniref:hypothetical protein n=1 Tax=Halomonas sp. ML-15 TaxID=2773305 RepID=UPI0017475FA4|nr:hypothetical protein [Halomonas sp. ML-15]MBD3895691.1 hypothetical protein [Halomonas sp. ML-15]
MKHTMLITTTLIAGILTLGMASQATAAEVTQTRFEVGSPMLGGTREGTHQKSVDITPQDRQAEYRTVVDVGSPAVGGTREGSNRQRVKVEVQQVTPHQAGQPEYAGPRVDTPRQGTTG